jgi:tetratricopeptide (TPR) repeat protein
LAEAEEALGNLEAAANLFAGINNGDHFGYHESQALGLTYSFAHQKAARLFGQLGDRDKAIEHWQAFLDAFTQPDPEFEWMVEEARAELERLEG